MAKIAVIGKYPPLEGGIAAKTYWLANALAERGHTIHVITDKLDVDERHTIKQNGPIPCHENVFIHRPEEVVPWHIPDDRQRSISLLNRLLEVLEAEKPDLIEANYLVPHGVIAYLAGRITGIPYVLRHGGSDIRKFLEGGIWPGLWRKALDEARLIITDADSERIVRKWSDRIICLAPYMSEPSFFRPKQQKRNGRRAMALIGKANYYWERKGWRHIVDMWPHLNEEFDLLVVSQGVGLESFRSYTEPRLGGRATWENFVPPWEMPDLLNSVDGVFCYEEGLSFPVFSNLALEALCCGLPVFTDKTDMVQHFRSHGVDLSKHEKQIVTLSAQEPVKAADTLMDYFSVKHEPLYSIAPELYGHYISSNEKALLEAIVEPKNLETA